LYLGSTVLVGGVFDLGFADASFVGQDEYDWSGKSVSSAGDVDGDGLSDLLIGAPGVVGDDGFHNIGKTYLFFGTTVLGGGSFDMRLADGIFVGEDEQLDTGDSSGSSAASAGDVDGDGLADILIGAPFNSDGGYRHGKSYAVFGSTVVAQLVDPNNNTFALDSAGPSFVGFGGIEKSGSVVSSAGDFNGDGLSDLLIGAPAYGLIGFGAPLLLGKTYLLLSPYATPDYAGLWTLTSPTSYSCFAGLVSVELVHLNITHRPTYSNLDPPVVGAYELTMASHTAQPGDLEGRFTSTDVFLVERTESLDSGACTATWALDGSYTDSDSLSADFSVTFAGACDDCLDQSWSVTGTR